MSQVLWINQEEEPRNNNNLLMQTFMEKPKQLLNPWQVTQIQPQVECRVWNSFLGELEPHLDNLPMI